MLPGILADPRNGAKTYMRCASKHQVVPEREEKLKKRKYVNGSMSEGFKSSVINQINKTGHGGVCL